MRIEIQEKNLEYSFTETCKRPYSIFDIINFLELIDRNGFAELKKRRKREEPAMETDSTNSNGADANDAEGEGSSSESEE
jgi:hypothetical protein